MRAPRSHERYSAPVVLLVALYLAALAAAVGWGLTRERPYPCHGRHNCSAQVMQ